MKYGVFFTSLLHMTDLRNIEAIDVFETFPGRKTYSCYSFCITIEISQKHKHPSDILHICFMPWNTWISRNICICKCMHALPLHAVLWWLHLTVLCTHLIIKHYTRTHLVLTFHCTVVCMFPQCRLFVCVSLQPSRRNTATGQSSLFRTWRVPERHRPTCWKGWVCVYTDNDTQAKHNDTLILTLYFLQF